MARQLPDPHLLPNVVVAEEAADLSLGQCAPGDRVVVPGEEVDTQDLDITAIESSTRRTDQTHMHVKGRYPYSNKRWKALAGVGSVTHREPLPSIHGVHHLHIDLLLVERPQHPPASIWTPAQVYQVNLGQKPTM